MSDETRPTRPDEMSRPKTGLAAWIATIGYIAQHHSPDVMLTVQGRPDKDNRDGHWSASLEWGDNRVDVAPQPAFQQALQALWEQIEKHYPIFKSPEDALRKPAGYGEFDWVDADTKDALDRLISVSRVVLRDNWSLILIYQPTDRADHRVQMRLVAPDNDVYVSGRGATFRDAANQLQRNATPYFSKRRD
jgi:hypothetical protein